MCPPPPSPSAWTPNLPGGCGGGGGSGGGGSSAGRGGCWGTGSARLLLLGPASSRYLQGV